MDGVTVLFVFILSVVLILAQFQLFAIKRYLHDLLQLQLALHGVIEEARFLCVAEAHPMVPLAVTLTRPQTTDARSVEGRSTSDT